MSNEKQQPPQATVGEHPEKSNEPHYWRSLEELAQTSKFQELLHREFPASTFEPTNPVSRRTFLKLMGASLALAGITSCSRQVDEAMVPYARPPVEAPYTQQVLPSIPSFYATAMTLGGFASGLLVESHMGRPTKVEGNPAHPASLGGTIVYAQASILTMYDPDRSQTVLANGAVTTWNAFVEAITPLLETQRASQGAGLHLLTETITSPTLGKQLEDFFEEFSAATWHQYDAVGRDNVHAGAQLAFGESVAARYQLDRAQIIVSLDSDFMAPSPGHVRYSYDFAEGRRIRSGQTEMNRLYVAEAAPSITSSMADNRVPVHAAEIEAVARALAIKVGVSVPAGGDLSENAQAWVDAVAEDLMAHRGTGVVLVGEQQPPAVHAIAHAINDALGNVGAQNPVFYIESVEIKPIDQVDSLRTLVNAMSTGRVEMLIIFGANPAFTAPVDLDFANALTKVNTTVHLGLYADETAAMCQWHIPEAHYLESWSDARAFDGTASIIQPLISPLFGGRTAHDMIEMMLGGTRTSHIIVQDYWRDYHQEKGVGGSFDVFWNSALSNGVVEGTTYPVKTVSAKTGSIPAPSTRANDGIELVFRPDPTIWDGRFANNAWLQELPKPPTQLTWDNAVLMSPNTAARIFGINITKEGYVDWGHPTFTSHQNPSDEPEVRGYFESLLPLNRRIVNLNYEGKTLQAPVWIVPGQADDSVTLYLGYGRQRTGQVGTGTGFNAYQLRTSDALWFASGVTISPTSQTYPLATTQDHRNMEGRHLVRVSTIEAFRQDPGIIEHMIHMPECDPINTDADPVDACSLFDRDAQGNIDLQWTYPKNAWGMAIDLNVCIGCSACMVACQAENNIPVVGRDQIAMGREMHWLRVDRYYEGPLDNPRSYSQPVPCMHCERAPCEVVCPVNATVHDHEGINQMIYNRCVGTRYCSNNCPYKVRHFNFFWYVDETTPLLKLARNPNVTVRSRGVMEKCTYCIQRINDARVTAKKETNGNIADGTIMTACEAACPTGAIVFGDTSDPNSRVSQLKAQYQNYAMLGELGVTPRTTYLGRFTNPHPNLKTVFDEIGGHGGGHGDDGQGDDGHDSGGGDH